VTVVVKNIRNNHIRSQYMHHFIQEYVSPTDHTSQTLGVEVLAAGSNMPTARVERSTASKMVIINEYLLTSEHRKEIQRQRREGSYADMAGVPGDPYFVNSIFSRGDRIYRRNGFSDQTSQVDFLADLAQCTVL
jgi:hypothetical protein